MSTSANAVDIDRTGEEAARRLGDPLRLQTIELRGCTVRVWTASLDRLATEAERHAGLLSSAERARTAAMRVPAVAARFCAGRATLRALLGAELGASPQEVPLTIGPHGKPSLRGVDAGAGLCFNVAHSSDVVAIAFTYAGEVGVDVERRRTLPALTRLVHRALSPGERELHARWLDEGAGALDAFLRAWTVKEARLKALGLPLGAGLSRDHPVARELPWTLLDLPTETDYVAAVAVAPARSARR